MSFNDAPIHLAELKICKQEMYSETSVTVPVWITQGSLDMLQALIRIHEGIELAGRGQVSGSFELVSFYRTLCNCIKEAEALATKEPTEGGHKE